MDHEKYTDMDYCRICRDFHEVTEELGSYRCGGQGPGEKPQEKLLDKALRGINETQLNIQLRKEKTHV